MDFHFPQKLKIGLGVSQQAGVIARSFGTRALVLCQPVNAGSREAQVVTQILERGGVKHYLINYLEGQNAADFLKEAKRIAKAGYTEVILTLGDTRLLSLGRKLADETSQPLIELPTSPVVPFLLRQEGWIGTGHPAEWQVFSTTTVPTVLLDPYLATGTPAIPSLAAYAEMVLLGLECASWEGADPLSLTLFDGVLAGWTRTKEVQADPTKAENRLEGFYSGLALAQMLAQGPRGPVWTALTVLQGITSLPAHSGAPVVLPALVEQQLHRRPGLVARTARGLGLEGEFTDDAQGAEALARALRRDLKDFGLPLRFQELSLLESELSLAADMVQALDLRKGFLLDGEALGPFLKGVC